MLNRTSLQRFTLPWFALRGAKLRDIDQIALRTEAGLGLERNPMALEQDVVARLIDSAGSYNRQRFVDRSERLFDESFKVDALRRHRRVDRMVYVHIGFEKCEEPGVENA